MYVYIYCQRVFNHQDMVPVELDNNNIKLSGTDRSGHREAPGSHRSTGQGLVMAGCRLNQGIYGENPGISRGKPRKTTGS
jgi:hypothetical protein